MKKLLLLTTLFIGCEEYKPLEPDKSERIKISERFKLASHTEIVLFTVDNVEYCAMNKTFAEGGIAIIKHERE